ncbi:MAG: PAS domain S-box protein, partial [Melioribacteraceae bacterium]|nr:PAS domain S-box protein [Melioribacteraceae bacterium]
MNLLSAQYSSYPNLAELIKSKAWLVVNDAGLIKYSNQTFSDVFALSDNENIESIQLEPNLRNVIEKLSENNINNFSFDAIYEYNEEIINYKIEIEKILLFNDNYYVVVFDPLKEEVILEEKINNLHYALEYGQIPVLIIDTNGKISFSTNSFEKILDFDLGIIYNNHISSLLSVHLTPDELKELEIAIQRGNEWSGTISTYTANGQSSYFELKLNPLLKEENNSLNFILTAHDITYYIFKNKITQKSERRLKSIINNISDLLLILKKINDQIYFEDANDNFYETFKINKTEAAQRRFSDTLPEKLFLKIDETIKTLIKDNVDTMEFEFMDINERYYDGKVTSIDDLIGKDSIFVISFKDLTEKKKHEEQLKRSFQKEQQLNRLKTTFLQ